MIQHTVWGRKGKICVIEPDLLNGILGGLELVHEYPSHTRESEGNLYRGRWRYISVKDITSLRVLVKNWEIFTSDKGKTSYTKQGMFLRIESFTSGPIDLRYYDNTRVAIPIGTESASTLLD